MGAGHENAVDAFPARREADDDARQHRPRLDLFPQAGTLAGQVSTIAVLPRNELLQNQRFCLWRGVISHVRQVQPARIGRARTESRA